MHKYLFFKKSINLIYGIIKILDIKKEIIGIKASTIIELIQKFGDDFNAK